MVIERWRPRWGITPWNLLKELEELEPLFPRVLRRLPAVEREWTPAIEMFEKEDKFVVKVELPGMKEKDVDVSVSDDTLTIKGEKKSESEVKEENYYCCERSYGSFYRSISLPASVDTKKIGASYEDGVLEVTLPKTAEVKPKKISVATKKEKTSK